MFDRQKIRDEISTAAWARWNQLNNLGMKGLVPAECADIAMRVLDDAGVFAPGAPAEVWYFTDDDEDSSPEVYLDAEAAKAAAVKLYESEYDPADPADDEFTWQEFTPPGKDYTRWHLHHGAFTGWSVDSIRVAAGAAGSHEHSWPVQPPHGTFVKPGNCTCGAPFADDGPDVEAWMRDQVSGR